MEPQSWGAIWLRCMHGSLLHGCVSMHGQGNPCCDMLVQDVTDFATWTLHKNAWLCLIPCVLHFFVLVPPCIRITRLTKFGVEGVEGVDRCASLTAGGVKQGAPGWWKPFCWYLIMLQSHTSDNTKRRRWDVWWNGRNVDWATNWSSCGHIGWDRGSTIYMVNNVFYVCISNCLQPFRLSLSQSVTSQLYVPCCNDLADCTGGAPTKMMPTTTSATSPTWPKRPMCILSMIEIL